MHSSIPSCGLCHSYAVCPWETLERPSPLITVYVCSKKLKITIFKLSVIGIRMQVHSTEKKHDKQCTNNENYIWLPVSLPNQSTLNIFRKPNIDAALWGPLSYYQSFYPSFFLSDTDVCLSLFICLFLSNFSFFLALFHILPKLLCISVSD